MQMVEERMTDILSIHASGSVERHLKGKQRQHFIDIACHTFDTALTPGPDLRANVVHHRQPGMESMTLVSEGSFIDAELVVRAQKLGFHIVQFGVDYFPRTRGVSTLSSPSVIVKLLKEMFALRQELRAIQPVART